jgi:hypothetical protein
MRAINGDFHARIFVNPLDKPRLRAWNRGPLFTDPVKFQNESRSKSSAADPLERDFAKLRICMK